MNRRLDRPATSDAEALRRLEELRDKMAADILAMQQRLEGVDLAIKILRETPF